MWIKITVNDGTGFWYMDRAGTNNDILVHDNIGEWEKEQGPYDPVVMKAYYKVVNGYRFVRKDHCEIVNKELKLCRNLIVVYTEEGCLVLRTADYSYILDKKNIQKLFDYIADNIKGITHESEMFISDLQIPEIVKPPVEISPTNPAHYRDGKIEVIEYIEDKKLDFFLGNAVKYISRAGKKVPTKEIEDLQKAIWYINRKIENMQKDV